jgi:hypothetical protein
MPTEVKVVVTFLALMIAMAIGVAIGRFTSKDED